MSKCQLVLPSWFSSIFLTCSHSQEWCYYTSLQLGVKSVMDMILSCCLFHTVFMYYIITVSTVGWELYPKAQSCHIGWLTATCSSLLLSRTGMFFWLHTSAIDQNTCLPGRYWRPQCCHTRDTSVIKLARSSATDLEWLFFAELQMFLPWNQRETVSRWSSLSWAAMA